MSDEARRIFEAAMQLPDAERTVLEEIEAAWIAEAERRREDLRARRTTATPWQEVRRELFDMIERAHEQRTNAMSSSNESS